MPTRLAEIVIDTALVDHDELMEIVKWADEKKLPLVAALVHHKGIDELALVGAIRRHVRIPTVDPAQVEHDVEATRMLPRKVCWRLRAMPLSVVAYGEDARLLRVAMADPTDAIAIAELEHITDCQVETALMPLSAIEELIDTAYRERVTEVMPRKRKSAGRAKAEANREVSADQKTVPIATREGAPPKPSPTTAPFHRVADEASLEIRHRALLELLVRKNLLTEEEYREQVRALMKRHADDA